MGEYKTVSQKRILKFFDEILINTTGYIRLAQSRKVGVSEPFFRERFFHWPDERIDAISFIDTEKECDYYFSPVLFDTPVGTKGHCLPTCILWADLDEAHPKTFPSDFPKPNYVFQTSEGRFQSYWLLNESIDASLAESFAKGIAYTVGADKSGWDAGQLLRIPYTHNYKYSHAPFIDRCKGLESSVSYPSSTFEPYRYQTTLAPVGTESVDPVVQEAQGLDAEKVLEELFSRVGIGSEAYLRALIDGDDLRYLSDRSASLWALETALAERGVDPAGIVAVAQSSAVNKYAGQGREWEQLAKEALKAIEKVESEGGLLLTQSPLSLVDDDADDADVETEPNETKKLIAVSARELSRKDFVPLSWAIDGILPEDEPLWIVAPYQSRKSYMALEIAIALATGVPAFGYFKTNKTGNVLYIQQEMTERQMYERLVQICKARGVEQPENLYIVSQCGFVFSDKTYRMEVERLIEDLDIDYVFFDPLGPHLGSYNVNDFNDANKCVRWLTMLTKKFGVVDIMVHHMNKQEIRPGVRLSQQATGSVAWNGHYATKLAALVVDKWGNVIKVERNTRSMGTPPDFLLKYKHSRDGGYDVLVEEMLSEGEQQTLAKVEELIRSLPKEGMAFETLLDKQVMMDEPTLMKYLEHLSAENKCLLSSDVKEGKRVLIVQPPRWSASDILTLLGDE